MKKRRYEKPSMKVHELAQRTRLLAGSSGSGGLENYNNGGDGQTWP